MKYFFHVGPHKTGTTAIQKSLRESREALLKAGIFVPEELTGGLGHHEIPWVLFGWDMRMIGAEFQEIDLEVYLRKVQKEALLSQCDTILFSSEDFSLCGYEHWDRLLTVIQNIAPDESQIEFKIGYVNRDLNELVVSQYKSLVLLGLDLAFDQVQEKLSNHFRNVYMFLDTLPKKLNFKLEILSNSNDSGDILSSFWASFFPEFKTSDPGIGGMFNASYSAELIEGFRNENSLAPVKFDENHLLHWPSFHDLSSISELAARRHDFFPGHDARTLTPEQLVLQRNALRSERDALRSERNALRSERDLLHKSRFWAITRPLRFAIKTFRSLGF